MLTESFQLKQCWDSQRIGQVINKEATSVDKATFMATHTPLTKLEYQMSLQQMTDKTEEGLFLELQRCAEHDIHVFMAIQGIPGSGKSHLIRWLKERYSLENGESECVLFIARAQCSLRSTLEQIINSGVFEQTLMHDQQEQLKNARSALSKEALAETILSQLFIESIEASEIHPPRWLKPREKLETFLSDIKIKRELLKRGGPIDRIVRYLNEGMGSGARSSDMPRFSESDFSFDDKLLREITGYPDAKEIARLLWGRRVEREELARYFNRLLSRAIGHVTALTSDDFKHIFLDLRRELRKQGRQLALFIEDITALTGIDLGLLDVLVAQHVGDTNQDLCRVTSVLGITNSYFRDHFPDHMKDRVTHSLTLNATTTNASDTEFLRDKHATAEMAARYLNAMRLKPDEIQQWFDAGSKPQLMPNACENCPVKTACHQAFGYQQIVVGPEEEELHIGLYPFNKTALWEFYQHIPTDSNKRTPRSFLHSVLYYILQSHGDKIKLRQFPPAPSDLGGEFATFSLKKPLQRSLIATQGKLDAKRIETLVAIWGNGTIDAQDQDQTYFVGTLSPEVFTAFGITLIQGEQLAVAPSDRLGTAPSALPMRVVRDSAPTDTSMAGTVSPPVSLPSEEIKNQQQDQKRHLYTDHITAWLNGGKLQRYEDYGDLLASMIRTFINWDAYEISSVQLDEVLKGRRNIYIEGQAGKANSAYFYTAPRSTELANVLHALFEIKEQRLDLKPDTLGAHISNLSIWLHQHEEEIVRFVRQPNHESTDALPFVTVLILDCLLVACLAGKLSASKSSSTDLLRNLMQFCSNTTAASWEECQSVSTKLRSSVWAGIVKRIKPAHVEWLCSTLPRVLNCAQGDSTSVLFIDAATALNVLEHFQQTNWQLSPSGCVGKPLRETWKEPLSTYEMFYTHFEQLIEEELQSVQKLITQLEHFLGDNTTEEVFQAIEKMINTLNKSNKGTAFTINNALNATRLNTLLARLRNLVKEQNFAKLALRLSQAVSQITSAYEYIEYFIAFEKEARKQKQATMHSLTSLQDVNPEIAQIQELTREAYQEIIEVLNKLTVKEGVQ